MFVIWQMDYLIGREGFEPPNPKEWIYSPPHLATLLPSLNVLMVRVSFFRKTKMILIKKNKEIFFYYKGRSK
jgi:hypothetical protein